MGYWRCSRRATRGAHTGEITAATGYDNATVGYHVKRLITHQLVEHAGKVEIGALRPANQYQLTDEG